MDEVLLTVNQLSRRLGVSAYSVYRWVKAGRLQAIPVGSRLIRFREVEVARFLAENGRGRTRNAGPLGREN